MAAALHPAFNSAHPPLHASVYPGLDYQDVRYPTLNQSRVSHRPSTFLLNNNDRSPRDSILNTSDDPAVGRGHESPAMQGAGTQTWVQEQRGQQYQLTAPSVAEVQSLASQSQQSMSQEPQRTMLQYTVPTSASSRRVVDRYGLDENNNRAPSRSSADSRQQDGANIMISSLRPGPSPSSTPRHPSLALVTPSGPVATGTFAMPLSASPSYNPPVSPNPRAYAQQPTYITPPTTPTPIKTVYSPQPLQPPPPPPPEEICLECAMRDQDMADVDVTSPGVWDRESDAAFEELKRRERFDEQNGNISVDISRPRPTGGRLTEQNLKLWLSINPREPTSRQQTLRAYITSQRMLLEAEALAHARAQQEAKQLDSKISRLRQSAYDHSSNGAAVADDTGGLRIRSSRTPSSPQDSHARSASREVTLLENGLIVEQVDVRREEKEERERRRKEERRARKLSRSSATLDVNSIISGNSVGPSATDSQLGLNTTYPRYSTAFSDVHSMGTTSPRRTRFFGAKNLSAGWRSQDSLAPSAISGSMVDMHLALQREGPTDPGTPRRSRLWSTTGPEVPAPKPIIESIPEDKSKKKRKGLAKIWDIVIGKHGHSETSNISASQRQDKDDDGPLDPPPPIPYLMNRAPGEVRASGNRLPSSPTLQSFSSSKVNSLASPSSATILPSPPSSRLSAIEVDNPDGPRTLDEKESHGEDTIGKSQSRGVHPVISEPNMRRHSQKLNTHVPPVPPFPSGTPSPAAFAQREKSLPPLPGEPGPRPMNPSSETRPLTVFTYDPQQRPAGASPAYDFLPPNAPFRVQDTRRQSFGGLSSRPNLTMPPNPSQHAYHDSRAPFGAHYDEFGGSRRSLGPMDQLKTPSPAQGSTMKRKSKFGLSLFLGKKNNNHGPEDADTFVSFPTMKHSAGPYGDEDLAYNARNNIYNASRPANRLSVTSRKALEERVRQDPQFVAYRYPSSEQQLDLFR